MGAYFEASDRDVANLELVNLPSAFSQI